MSTCDKNIINRLKRVEGQVRGVQNMVEGDKKCFDVITQLSAIRSAIDSIMGVVVAENYKDCLQNPDPNLSPEEQAAKMEEALQMIIKK